MPAAGAAMAAAAENSDLVYKIAFFQCLFFMQLCANIPCHNLKPVDMKSILILAAFPSLLAMQCNKQLKEIPGCIQQRIDQIKASPKGTDASEINEYLYKGKTVYLFTAQCCDFYNPLYDNSCNYICAPTGGITGSGDGKCSDFDANSKLIRLIWKDPR